MTKRALAVQRQLEGTFGIEERPRTHSEPLESLILTILSQSTTDLNSGRAFDNLKKAFSNKTGKIDWDTNLATRKTAHSTTA